ncbi:hypothetical protein ACPA9J_01810 [Pseudomonas aeruginosa]
MLLLWLVVLVLGVATYHPSAYPTCSRARHQRRLTWILDGRVQPRTRLGCCWSSGCSGWRWRFPSPCPRTWRRRVLSGPLSAWFQKVPPPMSDTEREAIEAAPVRVGWTHRSAAAWTGSKPPDYPAAQLTEEEQAFVDGPTEELCAMVSDWDIGQRMDLPEEAWPSSAARLLRPDHSRASTAAACFSACPLAGRR